MWSRGGCGPRAPGSPSKATQRSVRNMRAAGEGQPGNSTACSRRKRRTNSPSSRAPGLQQMETRGPSVSPPPSAPPGPRPRRQPRAHPSHTTPPAPSSPAASPGAASRHQRPAGPTRQSPAPRALRHEYSPPLLAGHGLRTARSGRGRRALPGAASPERPRPPAPPRPRAAKP